jgi:hypothetical protein
VPPKTPRAVSNAYLERSVELSHWRRTTQERLAYALSVLHSLNRLVTAMDAQLSRAIRVICRAKVTSMHKKLL